MRHSALAAIGLVACGTPARPTAIPAHSAASTAASCELAEPRRAKVELRYHAWIGAVGDRSWVMVERDEHQLELVTLGSDGRLAETVLPIELPDNIWWHVDGSHLWIEAGHGTYRYYDVDLATATPTVRVDPTVEARALGGASGFAIDATRALFYSFAIAPPGPGFELWDREHGKTLAYVPQKLVTIDEPDKRCVRDHCFAVTVLGDGPTRRLTALRFASDGALSTVQLADDHLGESALVPDGDRTHVVWTSYSRHGMFERTLDDAGEPVDTEAMLAPIGSDPVLVRGEPPQLAFNGGDQKWRVATLAPDGRSFAREVALPLAGSFVTAAPSRDGLLAIGFDSDVSEDTAVPPTKAAAVFVPLGGEPGHPIDVMFGEKHTSWVPFPLVSPGYAAVLVLTQGYGPAGGELVTLREPCAR